MIRAIDKASGGLDDLQAFGADGAEEFLGIAVDDGGVPTGRRSRHILISPSLLKNSAATRARLAPVLPLIMAAPLRVVISTDF